MLGAGNIGLIVSYQLIQAGVEVLAVIEGSPKIGGFLVHASKLRRMGVPILTSHSVKAAHGNKTLEAVTIWKLDENWKGIEGTEHTYDTDTLCVSVGLSPLTELLRQAGAKMVHVPALGGYVPYRDEKLRTSIPNVFAAGDSSGVEEASSAMVEGALAGIYAAEQAERRVQDAESRIKNLREQLEDLRRGEASERIRSGRKTALLEVGKDA
jgi:sarcosine oxidase subunit alpha